MKLAHIIGATFLLALILWVLSLALADGEHEQAAGFAATGAFVLCVAGLVVSLYVFLFRADVNHRFPFLFLASASVVFAFGLVLGLAVWGYQLREDWARRPPRYMEFLLCFGYRGRPESPL